MNFQIHQQKILPVPSASGLAKHRDAYYVLGDDSPFLFKLNSDFKIEEKVPLFADEEGEKIPKSKTRLPFRLRLLQLINYPESPGSKQDFRVPQLQFQGSQ